MKLSEKQNNEAQAATAFSKQSVIFDRIYAGNTIVQYKRERVRAHMMQLLKARSAVLELNSGTGEDAIWLAQQGHTVHATDIAAGMQQQLQQKVNALQLQDKVSTELISFTELENLAAQKQYDHIFSNFAGLNCTGRLDKVLHAFYELLKPGGMVTLVILPKFCLWEFILIGKGKFTTAFRRWFSSKGVRAHVEGTYFTCWYYNPGYIQRQLKNNFTVKQVEGLCTIVPPSYIEGFAEKYPRCYNFLKRKENKWKAAWPWKYIGDYYIISLQKNS